MFKWLKRLFPDRPEEPKVLVFLNPLVMLLAGAEQKKGSPLTREEVLAIRDSAICTPMPLSQAKKFHEGMAQQFPNLYPPINSERCWEEWQALNGRSESE
jgi:hypothetical protein